MQLELEKLEKSLSWEHVYSTGELPWEDDAVRLMAPVSLVVQVQRKGREIHLAGHLATSLAADCDRCLAPVVWQVAPAIEVIYVAEEDYAASRSEDLSQDDLLVAVHDGAVLDMDALVQEQLLLAVPSHLLCRVDCRGLCPSCGGNRNETECSCPAAQTDPRWAALKSLKFPEKIVK